MERQAIEVAGDVAGHPGICVVVPGASQPATLLEDGVPSGAGIFSTYYYCPRGSPDSKFIKSLSHTNSRDTSPDDTHVKLVRSFHLPPAIQHITQSFKHLT